MWIAAGRWKAQIGSSPRIVAALCCSGNPSVMSFLSATPSRHACEIFPSRSGATQRTFDREIGSIFCILTCIHSWWRWSSCMRCGSGSPTFIRGRQCKGVNFRAVEALHPNVVMSVNFLARIVNNVSATTVDIVTCTATWTDDAFTPSMCCVCMYDD